jgi:hypothetical protein
MFLSKVVKLTYNVVRPILAEVTKITSPKRRGIRTLSFIIKTFFIVDCPAQQVFLNAGNLTGIKTDKRSRGWT